jgi:GDP-L-fucose synthase
LQSSHVLPALIRKAHEAKARGEDSIEIWGTGAPRREFLHVDDCADALVFLMKEYSETDPVNVGSGTDVTIREAAEIISALAGLKGSLRFDTTKPDGTPRKLMSADRLRALGWRPKISFKKGVAAIFNDYARAVSSK